MRLGSVACIKKEGSLPSQSLRTRTISPAMHQNIIYIHTHTRTLTHTHSNKTIKIRKSTVHTKRGIIAAQDISRAWVPTITANLIIAWCIAGRVPLLDSQGRTVSRGNGFLNCRLRLDPSSDILTARAPTKHHDVTATQPLAQGLRS